MTEIGLFSNVALFIKDCVKDPAYLSRQIHRTVKFESFLELNLEKMYNEKKMLLSFMQDRERKL